MQENLNKILEDVLDIEKGFVNDARDNGGATNFGITISTLSAYRGKQVSVTDVKNLTKQEAIDIYKLNYWAPIKGDELPSGVDLIAFDACVNHGKYAASKMLQGAVGAAQDGVVGAGTIALLKLRKPEDVIYSIAEQRKQKYQSHEDWNTFKNGWTARLNGVTNSALKEYGKTWDFNKGLSGTISIIPEKVITAKSDFTDSDLQTSLKNLGQYSGNVDGDFGAKSSLAVDKLLAEYSLVNKIDFIKWPNDRRKNAAKQIIVKIAGFDPGVVDGWIGDTSKQAIAKFFSVDDKELQDEISAWRDKLNSPAIIIPQTSKVEWPYEKDMIKFYGNRGANLTKITLPYKMRIAWEPTTLVSSMSIHEKCADSALVIFRKTLDHYGYERLKQLDLDLFGGCFNNRLMRGSNTQWSIHSWGAAIDLSPDKNGLKVPFSQSQFGKPEYDAFWKIVESEGWLSLGRSKGYDSMHFQAARRP